MRWAAIIIVIGFCAGVRAQGPVKPITPAEKVAFMKLVEHLPHKAEFFTPEAVQTAAPHIAVLLALSEQDLGQKDMYPYLVLSSQLCKTVKYRKYGVEHFSSIAHPEIKMAWAVILFDRHPPVSEEIVIYLRHALETEKQAKFLAEFTGPDFKEFKKSVVQYHTPPKSR